MSKTDQLVIGFILHEIREEFNERFSFLTSTKKRGSKCLPRQIAYYLSNRLRASSTQGDIARFFKVDTGLISRYSKLIDSWMTRNPSLSIQVKRISSRVEQRIQSII